MSTRDNSRALHQIASLREAINNKFDELAEEDIPTFSANLANNFTCSRASDPPTARSCRKRRRTKTQHLKVRLTCLGSPETTVFSSKTINQLNAVGLGNATSDGSKSSIPLNLTALEFRTYLEGIFPKLRGTDYQLMRLDSNKRLAALPEHIRCPKNINKDDDLNRSALYIRPVRDIMPSCAVGMPSENISACPASESESEARSSSICKTCCRTFTTEFCLRCEQDCEFFKAQEIDLRNAHAKEVADSGPDMEMLRTQRLSRLPPENITGFSLRLRLPGNMNANRRFVGDQPIEDLFNFIGCQQGSTPHFSISVIGKPTLRTKEALPSLPLSAFGFHQSSVVNVAWDEESELDVTPPDLQPDYGDVSHSGQESHETEMGQFIDLTDADCDNSESVLPNTDWSFIETSQEPETKNVKLRKAHFIEDFIDTFAEDAIFMQHLNFELDGELAVDGGGVAREAMTRFWAEMQTRFGYGVHTKYLNVTNQLSVENWKSIGRILAKGYRDYGLLPVGFNKAFLVSCVCGFGSVDEDLLLSSILEDMPLYENDLYNKAVNGTLDDTEIDEFADVLDNYQASTIPKQDNVKRTFIILSETRFVQSPKCVIDNMYDGARSILSPFLPNPQKVLEALTAQLPTTKSVLKLFQNAIPLNEGEMRTLRFLKQYIKSCDTAQLQNFMRLLTGSATIVVTEISVTFLDPESSALFFRTCGPILDLPIYKSAEELANVFNGIVQMKMWDFNKL